MLLCPPALGFHPPGLLPPFKGLSGLCKTFPAKTLVGFTPSFWETKPPFNSFWETKPPEVLLPLSGVFFCPKLGTFGTGHEASQLAMQEGHAEARKHTFLNEGQLS